ncbi:MAG TPA: UDP-3-O-acyl-N-acetylglucosamine deacetylase [Candidatus Enterousia avicola]|uniref:UDP-3-O-acyl-N-acetylglucosamine deacetylase n=1 Tax=Candidatus Enterousia avicola TaxID=2840787 RepID=A0A9D1SMC6_9PROT|nr:UDP-3-O-acyl-N-acetylglucosamine deacetylase [Candidatus Enterousia avicola]
MPTLKKQVKIKGKGIHSGLPVNMVIKPSKKHGIFFRRVDLKDSPLLAALYSNVGETKMRNTTIGDINFAHVQTVEHLMAALFMAGIDSAIIEIDGKETPILDGSASQFYDAFVKAGITSGKIKKIVVRKPIIATASELRKNLGIFTRLKWWLINTLAGRKSNGYVKLEPNDKNALEITATLIYPEKIIGSQTYTYVFSNNKKSVSDFVNNIARARTFGKYSEWEYLKKRGMGRGADETNVIALNDKGDGTLNETIWPDEFVRHKIIDAIGDMYTSGGFVIGKLESFKGSHALNNLVLKKLFSDKDNYDII